MTEDTTKYIHPSWASNWYSANRITALDLARCLAMLMMIQGHSLDILANPVELDTNVFPWSFWNYCRGFTAQVFLLLSGAAHVFANKRLDGGKLSKKLIWRRIKMAVLLIFIGYFLMFPANKIWDLPFIEPKFWIPFFQVNILQLIGVTLLMILALFISIKNEKILGYSALSIAIIITILSPIVHSISFFDYLPEFLAAYFSFEHGSLFPLFPYSAFMFYGIFFGTIIKRFRREVQSVYILKHCFVIGLCLIGLGYGLVWLLKLDQSIAMKANPGAILHQIGFVMLGISVCAFIFSKTKQLSYYYILFSKRALFAYVIHLIILYGNLLFVGVAIIYPKSLSLELSIITAIAVQILTFGLIFIYEMSINKYPKSKKIFLYIISFIVLYSLLIGDINKW